MVSVQHNTEMVQGKNISKFRSFIGSCPQSKVMEFLLEWQEHDLSMSEIIKGAQIGRECGYKVMKHLLSNKIVKKTRIMGASKMYKLNEDNQNVQIYKNLFLSVITTEKTTK